jgi:hypothetical protein
MNFFDSRLQKSKRFNRETKPGSDMPFRPVSDLLSNTRLSSR